MRFFCFDLEGVLSPEVWVGLANRTGIDALRATTRDVPDYDRLMRQRLKILDEHGLGMADIEAVVAGMKPLDGARHFLDQLRERAPVVILSDTFYEFAVPMMRQLNWPTLLCHALEVDGSGRIVDYRLRHRDHKRASVNAFRELNFHVTAIGDSYNDIAMLGAADAGILFRAPETVRREFSHFPAVDGYDDLMRTIQERG